MKIPADYMKTSVDNWVNYGCPAPHEMGSFLRALLLHDLMASAMFADDHNRARLADWATYLHCEIPSLAHGSVEKLEAWHKRGGLFGRQTEVA